MNGTVMIFDLETRLDKAAVGRAHRLDDDKLGSAAESFGDKFPHPIFHEIICIGVIRASQVGGVWKVDAFGAPHMGQRDEKELISSFVAAVDKCRPRLISFNGSSFDLPVLRYRGGMHRVFAPGLYRYQYFHRYSGAAVDLCDMLASFDGRGKVGLDTLCRVWGIPGKPNTIDGSLVAGFANAARFEEIAQYCEHDVAATYMVWLRHELFTGRLTPEAYTDSESAFTDYIFDMGKFHLREFLAMRPVSRAII